jgi:cation/acetate symporter
MARFIMVGVAAGAAALTPSWHATAPELLQWAMALAAAGMFAPLVLGLWWHRCNEIGALGGMVAGFGFVGLIFLMAERIIPAVMVTSDWSDVRAPTAGLTGAMISSIVTIGLSLATPASKADAEALLVDAEARRRQPPIRERPA